MLRRFADRAEAGARLGELLRERDWHDPLVLGLARGGVPVAAEVARALRAPLDVIVARKIGAPGHPEYGIGAVAAEGPPLFHDRALRALGLTAADLDEACARERAEARRRLRAYHADHEPAPARDRDVLVVDDGLATGVTATAAVRGVRACLPRSVVFAAPVCAPDGARALRADADDVVCLAAPERFAAVGQWYDDFAQTTDEQVVRLLDAARTQPTGSARRRH